MPYPGNLYLNSLLNITLILIPVFPWAAPKCDPKPVSFRIGECKSKQPRLTTIEYNVHSILAVSPLFTRTTSDELLVGQVGCVSFYSLVYPSRSCLLPSLCSNEIGTRSSNRPRSFLQLRLFKNSSKIVPSSRYTTTSFRPPSKAP